MANKNKNPKRKPSIFVISGPSGSGKTTLTQRLLNRSVFKNALIRPVSFTTRAIRRGERRDVDYYFVSLKEFNRYKAKKEFLESQEVFGNYYATSKKEIEKILSHRKDVLLSIDVKGAQVVRRLFPKQVILLFILPPDFRILHQRLQWRATERSKDLRMRLEIARQEVACAELYDYVVVNDNLKQAARALEAIILAERAPFKKG